MSLLEESLMADKSPSREQCSICIIPHALEAPRHYPCCRLWWRRCGYLGSSTVFSGCLVHRLLPTTLNTMNNMKSPSSSICSLSGETEVHIFTGEWGRLTLAWILALLLAHKHCASVFHLIHLISQVFLLHLSVVMDTKIKHHLLSPFKAVWLGQREQDTTILVV